MDLSKQGGVVDLDQAGGIVKIYLKVKSEIMKVAYGIGGVAALCVGFAGGLVAAPHLFPPAEAVPGPGWVDLSELPEELIAWHTSPTYLKSEVATFTMVKEKMAVAAARPKRVLPEGVPAFPGGVLYMPPEGAHWPKITPLGDTEGTLAAAQNGGWTVLNLWATWCAPCVKELPDMDAAVPLYAAQGVTLLALNADPGEKDTLEGNTALFERRGVTRLQPLTAKAEDIDEVLAAMGTSRKDLSYPANMIFAPGGKPYAVFEGLRLTEDGDAWSSEKMTTFFKALSESGAEAGAP